MATSCGDVLWHCLVETSDDVDDNVDEDLYDDAIGDMGDGVDVNVWSRRVMAVWMMT